MKQPPCVKEVTADP